MIKKLLLAVLLVLNGLTFAQLDRSKRPEPGPAPEIKIGSYESFELDNGLKVFVVENHKQPVVNFSLVLDLDPIAEKENKGYISLAGELLRTGTKARTKDQIDEEVDFLGASLSTSASSIYASSLKKHTEKLLNIVSDIILNYNFKQDELDKLKKQTISGLQTDKDDPNAIAGNVENVLFYGKEHPYGEVVTEESVNRVTLDMCTGYINKYFRPNAGYLAVVGDINKDEAEKLVKKYFSKWQKGDVPKETYKIPAAPKGVQVAIVDRPTAVQSVIDIGYPVDLKPGSIEAIKASVMNTILGGTSFSKLFSNLREAKGYTYGAYSSINPDEFIGSFSASLQARNAVTDSSVTEVLKEMRSMKKETINGKELQEKKNYVTGSFARSLENPQTVARFAINTTRYSLPKDYYQNYLKRVAEVTPADVKKSAEKYIHPDNTYVLVVGNASQVKEGLKKFGPITFYDIYGNKVDTTQAAVPVGMTAEKVIDNFFTAIGGKEAFEKITDRTTVMEGSVQGIPVSLTVYQKAPDKMKSMVSAAGMEQGYLYNGTTGYMILNGNKTELRDKELDRIKFESTLGAMLDLKKNGITAKLAGMQKVNGEDAYKLELSYPSGLTWAQYYSKESGLKLKEEKMLNTPQGDFTQEIYYSDYRDVSGVKHPYKMRQSVGPQNIEFTVTDIKINTGLTDDIFEIK